MSVFRRVCGLLAVFLLSPHGSYAAPTDATVRVAVTGLRNAQGDVGCRLFNSPDGYPEGGAKAFRELHVAVQGDQALCDFKEVPSGTYAVIVLHDENLNGTLDKNFMGIPQEGYAASNNVRHLMSAPEFKEASFLVPAGTPTAITVQVRY